MQGIDGLIFDMDGLLLDSERVVRRTWDEAGEQLGYGKIGEHIRHTLGFNARRRELYFRSAFGEDFPMAEFQKITRRRFYEIVDAEGLAVKEGARELLRYAKDRGLRLGVATSSRREYSEQMLTRAGILGFFDGCVFGDMVTQAKPDPEIYLRACACVGVAPERAMALEDAPSGIRSAHAAGMRPVMVPDLVEPDGEILRLCFRRVNSLRDVVGILEE